MKKIIKKLIKIFLVFSLSFSWILTGWPLGVREVQASIAFRAAGAEVTGTNAQAVALPTGVAANDIVILVASTIAGGSLSITANGSISTWTEITSSGLDVASGEKLYVWWGRYSSGSTGPTVSPGSDHIEAATVAYSGIVTSGSPVDISTTGTETVSDTSLSFATGVATSVDGTKVILVTTNGTDSNTNGQYSSEANTSLSAISERVDYSTASGGGGGIMVTEATKATAGTMGTWTSTLATASTKAYISFSLKPQNTTTIADGSNPSNVSLAPAGATTDLDSFTLITDNGVDIINSLTATLGPTGAYNNVDHIDITDNSNNIKCTVSSLSSNTLNFTSCGLAITSVSSTFKLRLTPKSHSNMPSPNGATYDIVGTITSWTSVNANTQLGSDSGSATITIDNLSPNSATSVSGASSNAANSINWTTSSSSDFDTTSGSVVLRWAASSAGSEVPVEGTTNYSAGNTISTATVACVISSAASTLLSKTDGTGGSSGCTTSALTNGQAYSYKVFQRDTKGNYDTGTSIGTFTPAIISITITSDGSVDYGIVAASGRQDTTTSGLNDTQTIRNDGTGAEDFTIKTSSATSGTQWSLGSASGVDTFVHEFSTNSGGAWTKFTTADIYQSFVSNVVANGTQNFDLRITIPSSSTDYQQKNITVVILATQH